MFEASRHSSPCLLFAGSSTAQTFEKKNFNYSEFAKGAFSEVVTVTGPAKLIYLAGIGSEDEKDGSVRHKDDFLAQCRFAVGESRQAAEGARRQRFRHRQGDHLRHRHSLPRGDAQVPHRGVRRQAAAAATLLNIVALARPGMMFEVDVVAAVAAGK